jgi:hypothetical protein
MTNIFQFNCSGNASVVAFSNDKTGANIPATEACNGEWILYVENIINDSTADVKDNYPHLFEDVATKGWHITSSDKIMKTQ